MAFTNGQRTPTTIGNIKITLRDLVAVGADPARQALYYQFEVFDQNGEAMALPIASGDLEKHLTAQQTTQLKSFMTTIRNKIVAELT